MKKGFTLVELLAVIVILAIILAIAIPNISNIIASSSKSAFESDAKLLLKSINYKVLENSAFSYTAINETNIKSLLNIDDSNYDSITVSSKNNNPYVIIVGKNKWANLIAEGSYNNISVHENLLLWLDAGNPSSYSGTGNTWYDLSGHDFNATIYGSNVWTSLNDGMFDFGEVDQITNYVSLPYLAPRATGEDYTLEFWMRPSATSTNYFSSMAASGDSNYFLLAKGTTALSKWNMSSNSVSFSDDEILQFVIVRKGSDTGMFYKNGTYINTSTGITKINNVASGGWILNQEQDSVGGTFTLSEAYKGAFMVVRLYNKALSNDEIKDNFNSLKNRYGL